MSLKDRAKDFIDEAQDYAEARLEYAQLNAVEKASNSVAAILAWVCISAVILLCAMLLSVLAVCALEMLVNSYLIAIALVLGIYLLVLVFVILFQRKLLIDPIKNKLLGIYLDLYEDETNG